MLSAAVLASIILRLAPVLAPEPETAARYAEDIIAVAPNSETALAMVSTGKAESDFRPRIERCEYVGAEADHGKAAGLFQTHVEHWQGFRREDICRDNRLASKLAADSLARYRRITGSWKAAFRRFTGCVAAVCPELRGRDVLFRKLVEETKGAV